MQTNPDNSVGSTCSQASQWLWPTAALQVHAVQWISTVPRYLRGYILHDVTCFSLRSTKQIKKLYRQKNFITVFKRTVMISSVESVSLSVGPLWTLTFESLNVETSAPVWKCRDTSDMLKCPRSEVWKVRSVLGQKCLYTGATSTGECRLHQIKACQSSARTPSAAKIISLQFQSWLITCEIKH